MAWAASGDAPIDSPVLKMALAPGEGVLFSDAVVEGENVEMSLGDAAPLPVSVKVKAGEEKNVSYGEVGTDDEGSFKGQFYVSRSDSKFTASLDFTDNPLVFSFEVKREGTMEEGVTENLFGIAGQYGVQMQKDKILFKAGETATVAQTITEPAAVDGTYWNKWRKVIVRYDGNKMSVAIEGVNNGAFSDNAISGNNENITFQNEDQNDFNIGYNSGNDSEETQYKGAIKDIKMYNADAANNDSVKTAESIEALETAVAGIDTASPSVELKSLPVYTATTTWTNSDGTPVQRDFFRDGITYIMTVVLSARAGYTFEGTEKPTGIIVRTDGSKNITLNDSDVTLSDDNQKMTIVAMYDIEDRVHPTGQVVVDADMPIAGNELASPEVDESSAGEYSLVSGATAWTDDNGSSITQYTADTNHTLTVKVSPAEGRTFTSDNLATARFFINGGSADGAKYVHPTNILLDADGNITMSYTFATKKRVMTYLPGNVKEDGTVELSNEDKVAYNGTMGFNFDVVVTYTAIEDKNYALATLTDGEGNFMTLWHNPSKKAVSFSYKGASDPYWTGDNIGAAEAGVPYRLTVNADASKSAYNNLPRNFSFAGGSEGNPASSSGNNADSTRRFLYTGTQTGETRWQVEQVLIGKKAPGATYQSPGNTLTTGGQSVPAEISDADDNVAIKYVQITNQALNNGTDAGTQAASAAGSKEQLKAYLDSLSAYQSGDYTVASWTEFDRARQAAQSMADNMTAKTSEVSEAFDALKKAEAGLVKLVVGYLTPKLDMTLTGVADSEEVSTRENGGAAAEKALDGQLDTYWHTNWDGSDSPNASLTGDGNSTNNNFYIKLQSPAKVRGVTYVPYIKPQPGRDMYESSGRSVNRSYGNNGMILKCKIYTSSADPEREDAASLKEMAWTPTQPSEEEDVYELFYTYSNAHLEDRDKQEKQMVFSKASDDVKWVRIEVYKTDGADRNSNSDNFINATEFGLLGETIVSSENDLEKAELLIQMQEALASAKPYYDGANVDYDNPNSAPSPYGRMDYEAFESAYKAVEKYVDGYDQKDLKQTVDDDSTTLKEAIEEAIEELWLKKNKLDANIPTPQFDVAAPVIGMGPVNAVQTDNSRRYEVSSITWEDEGGAAVTTFTEGATYKEKVNLQVIDGTGQKFTEDSSAKDLKTPESLPYGAQSVETTISEDGLQMEITYTFVAKIIQIPTLVATTPPAPGARKGDVVFAEESEYYAIDGDPEWSRVGAEEGESVDVFRDGFTYRAKVTLKIEDEKEVIFGKQDVVVGAESCKTIEDGKKMEVYMTFAMPGMMRWDDITGEVDFGSVEEEFFRNIQKQEYPDLAFDMVFKRSEASTANTQRMALLTLTDGNESSPNYLTFWYRPSKNNGGSGEVGYEGSNMAEGAIDPSFTKGAITDTAWHKLSVTVKQQTDAQGARTYTYYAWLDGANEVTWSVVDVSGNNTFSGVSILNQFFSLSGDNYTISKAYLGTKAPGVTYRNKDMADLDGEMKYVAIRTEKAVEKSEHLEHHKEPGEEIKEKYDDLIQTWTPVVAANNSNGEFEASAWTNFTSAWGSVNKSAVTEWDIYNAVDAIEAAVDTLEESSTCTCSVTLDEIAEQSVDMKDAAEYTVDIAKIFKDANAVHPNNGAGTVHQGDPNADDVTYTIERADGSGNNMVIRKGKLVLTGAGKVKVDVIAKYHHGTSEAKTVTINVTNTALDDLKSFVNRVETMYSNSGLYSKRRWDALQSRITEAKELYDQATISSGDIANAYANVSNALSVMTSALVNYNVQTEYWDEEDRNSEIRNQSEDADTWLYQVKENEAWTTLPVDAFKKNTTTLDGVQSVWMSNDYNTYGAYNYASIRRTQLTPALSGETQKAVGYTWVAKNGDWGTLGGVVPKYVKMYLKNPVTSKTATKADVTLQITQETQSGDETVLAEQIIAKGAQNVDVSGLVGYAKMENLKYLRLAALKAENDIQNIEVAVEGLTTAEYAEQYVALVEKQLPGNTKASRDAVETAIAGVEEKLQADPLDEDQLESALETLRGAVAGLKKCNCTIAINTFTLDKITVSDLEAIEPIDLKEKVTVTRTAGDPDDNDTEDAYEYVFEADGAGAEIVDGTKLKVTKAGKVEVKVTVNINGRTDEGAVATATTEAEVETPALKALNDYIQNVNETYPNNNESKYDAEKWRVMQEALREAQALADSAKETKAAIEESSLTDQLDALKSAVTDLICECTIEITSFTVADAVDGVLALQAEDMTAGKTVELTAQTNVSKDSCEVEGHQDGVVTLKFVITKAGAGAEIVENTKLKVVKAGSVTVRVTASMNDKIKTETMTIQVTTPASRELSEYVAGLEEAYPNTADGKVGYPETEWNDLQDAIVAAKEMLQGAVIDKTEDEIAQEKAALEAKVAELKENTVCNCTIEIESFTLDDIEIPDGASEQTVNGLSGKVTVKTATDGCRVEGHADGAVALAFAASGAGASIEGKDSLKVTKAGRVTVTVTASLNGKSAAKEATATVTTPASRELSEYVAELEEAYPNTADGKVGYPETEWNDLQDAIVAAKEMLQGTVSDKTEDEIAQEKAALEAKVAELKENTVCNCTIEIESFTLDDIEIPDGASEQTVNGLSGKVTVKTATDGCRVEGHADGAVALAFAASGAGASIEGKDNLKVTKAGRVTVTVTASLNGKSAAKEATATVTTSALKDLNTYLGQVKEQYSETDYTLDSWAVLDAAIEAAEALANEATVEESDIAAKKKAVEAAVAALVENAPKDQEKEELVGSLDDLVEEMADKAEDSGVYDEESWNAFVDAYEAAVEALSKSDELDMAALQKAKDDLQKAYDGLKTKEEKEKEKAEDDLQKVLDEMQDILGAGQEGYSNESWEAFREAYLKAKNHAGDMSAEELNNLLKELNAAKNALADSPELTQAKKDLASLLEDAKKTLDAGKGEYPDAVWSAFQNAYNAASQGKDGVDVEAIAKLSDDLKTALANVKNALAAQKPQPGGQKQPTGDNLPKAGTQYTVGKLVYQVKTSTATDKTVMVMNATSKTQKKITIPATVTISGQAYKVVEIKANAFAKNKKLTTVKIGKNVTKIGKKAFFGCAKLKKVTIKATGLKTIGKQAFAKINKKARIRVPKKQLKTLKKKLKKAKTIKSAKITK